MVTINVAIPEELKQWLDSKDEPNSSIVRALLMEEFNKSSINEVNLKSYPLTLDRINLDSRTLIISVGDDIRRVMQLTTDKIKVKV